MDKKQIEVRGLMLGDGTPKICVPLTAGNMKELRQQVRGILEGPFDLVEWRADFFEEGKIMDTKKAGELADEAGQADSEAGQADAEVGQADAETGQADSKAGQADAETGQADSKAGQADAEAGQADSGAGQTDWVEHTLRVLRSLLGDCPILFTFRTGEEGGARTIPMEEYEALCVRAAASGLADLVDVELNRGEERLRSLTEKMHSLGCRVIGSYHDFGMTPERKRIVEILCRIQSLGADISKVAVMPRTEEDVMELLAASVEMKKRQADRPYITMSMGRLGAVSRLAGALTGSAVTFAAAGKASAPGQMDAQLVGQILPLLQTE